MSFAIHYPKGKERKKATPQSNDAYLNTDDFFFWREVEVPFRIHTLACLYFAQNWF